MSYRSHRNALLAGRRPRIQDQVRMHVRSLAIQDQTACSRSEGLSDMMARNMDREEDNKVTRVFGVMVKRQTQMNQTSLVAEGCEVQSQ